MVRWVVTGRLAALVERTCRYRLFCRNLVCADVGNAVRTPPPNPASGTAYLSYIEVSSCYGCMM